jgi:hypothetical protein
MITDFCYAGINDHFGADGTWQVGAKKCGALNGNTMIRCLYNGILLGMYPSA